MFLVVLLAFLAASLLTLALFKTLNFDRDRLKARLDFYRLNTAKRAIVEDDELNLPLWERAIKPVFVKISQTLARIAPARSMQKTERLLELAGNPGNLKAQGFQVIQYGLALVFGFCGFLFTLLTGKSFFWQVIAAATLGLLGYYLSIFYLHAKAKARKNALQKELPSILDLLTVSVEAGLGFDAALHRVTEKSQGVLVAEIRILLQKIQMGTTRREALRELSERTETEDIQVFVTSMIQAEQLGISIGRVLRIQAEQARIKRRQRIEEKAMKAPIIMLFPLIFCIFPTIFVVLLGPAFISIFKMFSSK